MCSYSVEMSALSYRPELDGLRSVAVYLVLAFHAGVVTMSGGFIGVDLFFVLSGFLVTQVVAREVDRSGTVRLGDFYARRVRRLLPAAVVVVVLTGAAQVLLVSLPLRLEMIDDARAALLYYANWHFVVESRDYFADAESASPFLHFWSLAVEEQFYIVFPLLVLLTLRTRRDPQRALSVLVGAVFLVSVVAQVITARYDPDLAYYGTHTRAYQLAAGALLAIWTRRSRTYRGSTPTPPHDLRVREAERAGDWVGVTSASRRATRAGRVRLFPVAALVVIVVLSTNAVDLPPWLRGILATLAAVSLIAALTSTPDGSLVRVLGFWGSALPGTDLLWHLPVALAGPADGCGAVRDTSPRASHDRRCVGHRPRRVVP